MREEEEREAYISRRKSLKIEGDSCKQELFFCVLSKHGRRGEDKAVLLL